MIELRNLSKSFVTKDGPVDALRHVNLTIRDGDIYGIIGMSGAGKSTLVRCINMLERPTEGSVILDGQNLGELSKKDIQRMRHQVTMIFQSFNLLMQRSCLRNVMFPLLMSGVKRDAAEKRARELLEIVGLPDKANAYPAQLSGGQQQRVAIARALTTNPSVLLCDEATSALDPKTTHAILSLIRDINRQMGITVIVITHQMSVVEDICRHVAILDGGHVVEEGSVSDVFASPKSDAARRLVFPEGYTPSVFDDNPDVHKIRVLFNGDDTATEPVIAKMAVELGVFANIMAASTKTVEGKAYGTMLLGVNTTEDALRLIDYLKRYGVYAEEVH